MLKKQGSKYLLRRLVWVQNQLLSRYLWYLEPHKNMFRKDWEP